MAGRNFVGSMVVLAVLVGVVGVAAERAEAWPWPWVNPEIYNSGSQVSGAYYDPFTGRVVIRTDRTRVRESYLDPARNFVDPGSKHYVDYVQTDANGVQWRVRGWKWTSNGVPHGNLQRTRIRSTGIPGVAQEENDRVLYSYHPGSKGNKSAGQRVGRSTGQGAQRYGRQRQRAGNGYNPF